MDVDRSVRAVSLDLFGTLVAVERRGDPAAAVAAELERRGVRVPEDWDAAYAESHATVSDGAELPLPDHVSAALASRSEPTAREVVEDAVRAAFEPGVRTRPGAVRAVDELADRLPVGVLSNCSVPSLAERALARSRVDVTALDAVVASVDCGWRKPDARAFEAAATELGVELEDLLHVGDDPGTDGRATDAGATALLLDEVALAELPEVVERRWRP